jgi:hypothetical protein
MANFSITCIIYDLWPQTSKPTVGTNGHPWIKVNQVYESLSSPSGFDMLVPTVPHVAFLSKDGIIACGAAVPALVSKSRPNYLVNVQTVVLVF